MTELNFYEIEFEFYITKLSDIKSKKYFISKGVANNLLEAIDVAKLLLDKDYKNNWITKIKAEDPLYPLIKEYKTEGH